MSIILKNIEKKSRHPFLDDRKQFFYQCPAFDDINIIHTFNTICFTANNWCASFETALPRMLGKYDGSIQKMYKHYLSKHAIHAMCQDNCIGLFALSESALNIHKQGLQDICQPKEYENILSKTKVLHPPQNLLISYDNLKEKFYDIEQELRFCFIGTNFFWKGGAVACKVLKEFLKQHPIKLTIIGNVFYNKGYSWHVGRDKMLEMKQFIMENSDWIHYYPSLPNKMVLEILKQSHIGLLPSYHDTYGYACLEMQAAGCPVITTDHRAFPEINNNICGWICEIDNNLERICPELGQDEPILGNELRRNINDLLEHMDVLKEKGKSSMERIEKYHSPQKYVESLKTIYSTGM